ncbi:MAG: hypothetical protein LBG95_05100 [Treponema sp.]|nr:hypothetical protein [Treponema sp.]
MKKKIKLEAIRRIAGIIAIVAIIGFSLAACEDVTKGKTIQLSMKRAGG